jgi:hypothetical protein
MDACSNVAEVFNINGLIRSILSLSFHSHLGIMVCLSNSLAVYKFLFIIIRIFFQLSLRSYLKGNFHRLAYLLIEMLCQLEKQRAVVGRPFRSIGNVNLCNIIAEMVISKPPIPKWARIPMSSAHLLLK